VDLHHCLILKHLRDHYFWIRTVMGLGIAYPASLIVGSQYLRSASPFRGVSASIDWPSAAVGMGENGAYLAVWAGWQQRLVAEEKNCLSGSRVSEATPERFTAGGPDLNYWISRRISPVTPDVGK